MWSLTRIDVVNSLPRQLDQTLPQGFSEEVSSIAAVSRATKISQYRDELAQLGLCSKHSFKKSEWKGQSECKWAPVNLHAQVLEVNTVDQKTNISCKYIFVSFQC